MTHTLRAVLVLGAVLCTAAPAFAQRNVGVRAGVSGDPDQFFFGGHVESGPLMRRVTFRPNAEIGVGDGLTTVALNIEFVYSLRLSGEPARIYFGAGPSAIIYSGRGDDDTDVAGGLNFLVGLQHDRGLFGELKVGAIDSPSVKVTVGYAFR